ncbi:MAG: DUF2334 domain-containing protein [Dehalococcoidia bacterium]|nr:DUF2334 domain-containing protein [Dehalococcoidia bacterium]
MRSPDFTHHLPYPSGKSACVVMSFDDLHPGRSGVSYDGGGDLEKGALGWLRQLLALHPQLRVVLFTVAAWREKEPAPNPVLKRIPVLRDHLYLGGVWSESMWRLDNHGDFCNFLRDLPRTELAVHGFHHIARGVKTINEFLGLSVEECKRRLLKAEETFQAAGLSYVRGFSPPNWNAPPALLGALSALSYEYLASTRDIWTEIEPDAVANGSGLKGVPLLHPSFVPGHSLVHMPSNWSATSTLDRAYKIIDLGGMLAIKGHMVKRTKKYVAVDGLDEQFFAHLHNLLTQLEQRYGASLWWAGMNEVAACYRTGKAVTGDAT